MDSKLVNAQQQEKIQEWLGNKKLELLYSASRDGFSSVTFHKYCDSKGPTLVIVKSEMGYLFGGYTSTSWDQTESFKGAESFLFSLTSPHNIPPTKYQCTNKQQAIYCHSSYGPTFGVGHDLHIYNNSNITYVSHSTFPRSYLDTTGYGRNTFAGASTFKVVDIEVFQVL